MTVRNYLDKVCIAHCAKWSWIKRLIDPPWSPAATSRSSYRAQIRLIVQTSHIRWSHRKIANRSSYHTESLCVLCVSVGHFDSHLIIQNVTVVGWQVGFWCVPMQVCRCQSMTLYGSMCMRSPPRVVLLTTSCHSLKSPSCPKFPLKLSVGSSLKRLTSDEVTAAGSGRFTGINPGSTENIWNCTI